MVTEDGRRILLFLANPAHESVIRFYAIEGGQEVFAITPPGNENFHAVALNAQGTRLAARTDNGIYVWDATPLPD